MALFIFLLRVTLQLRFCLTALAVRDLALQLTLLADISRHHNISECGEILTMERDLSIKGVWVIETRPPMNTHCLSQSSPTAELTSCKQSSCRNISQALLPFTFHSLILLVVQSQTPAGWLVKKTHRNAVGCSGCISGQLQCQEGSFWSSGV